MTRGEIWIASLPAPRGSGPGYRRPVLIVSDDRFNASTIATVIVAVVTSNTDLANAPGNVLLRKREAGLPKASVVNVSQLYTLDRILLAELLGTLAAVRIDQVDAGLRLALGL